MNELLEQLLQETDSRVNELDLKKGLKTALATGLIGGAAFGLGYKKGLVQKDREEPVATTKVQQPVEKLSINVNKIAQIESNNNPRAINRKSGARGLCQIIKPTWEECVRLMGEDWLWSDAFDPVKNRKVADFYLNVRIPQMLRFYSIPDTSEIRLACYNWGVGNVKRAADKHGVDFLVVAPEETKNYIRKYMSL